MLKRLKRIPAKQSVTAFSDHHRINDNPFRRVAAKRCSNNSDNFAIIEHPHLDSINSEIRENAVKLLLYESGRNRQHTLHPQRILGGKCCWHTRRINAKSTDCFHIGDQSCSPRGINACYCQDIRDSFLRAYVHSFSNTVIMRAVAPAHFCAKFLAAAPAALRSSGCLSHCSS